MWSWTDGPWGILSLSKAAEDVCERMMLFNLERQSLRLSFRDRRPSFLFSFSQPCLLALLHVDSGRERWLWFSSWGWTVPSASVSIPQRTGKWWAFVSRAVQGPTGLHQINLNFGDYCRHFRSASDISCLLYHCFWMFQLFKQRNTKRAMKCLGILWRSSG